jgi:hypothetical protein
LLNLVLARGDDEDVIATRARGKKRVTNAARTVASPQTAAMNAAATSIVVTTA